MRNRRPNKYEPTSLERLADMIIQLHRSPLFPMTIVPEALMWRGKPVRKLSVRKAIGDSAASEGLRKRQYVTWLSKLSRVIQEKIIAERVETWKKEAKQKGMRASVAEDAALERAAKMFGLEVDRIEYIVSGRAAAQRRKPKELRAHARRKRRAKIAP